MVVNGTNANRENEMLSNDTMAKSSGTSNYNCHMLPIHLVQECHSLQIMRLVFLAETSIERLADNQLGSMDLRRQPNRDSQEYQTVLTHFDSLDNDLEIDDPLWSTNMSNLLMTQPN